VGVLGATSFVGACLIPLLIHAKYGVIALSRSKQAAQQSVQWISLPQDNSVLGSVSVDSVPLWIAVCPIVVVPQYFELLERSGVRRLVVLSSTSRFTKTGSSSPLEQELAASLARSEQLVEQWAKNRGVEWVVLRPTLIYGLGLDRNINEIARFIQRFGFFPTMGRAVGMRQPIHARDVAKACVSALASTACDRAYNISGAETLSYRSMVERVFGFLGRKPLFLPIPLFAFQIAIGCMRVFPRFAKWTPAMAQRMNQDLVFDHSDASRDLGFKPRQFLFDPNDIVKR
jgi:nucleoside-diphosphate-sugar epimerase